MINDKHTTIIKHGKIMLLVKLHKQPMSTFIDPQNTLLEIKYEICIKEVCQDERQVVEQ